MTSVVSTEKSDHSQYAASIPFSVCNCDTLLYIMYFQFVNDVKFSYRPSGPYGAVKLLQEHRCNFFMG